MSDDPMAGLGDLFRQAQQLQEQLMEAQERAAEEEVEGQAGGGAVRVTLTGGLEVRRVRIDPGAVDPADVSMLEDMVVAALRDALDKVRDLTQESMGGLGLDVSSLFGGGGGGLGGGGLGGGLGGGGELGGFGEPGGLPAGDDGP